MNKLKVILDDHVMVPLTYGMVVLSKKINMIHITCQLEYPLATITNIQNF